MDLPFNLQAGESVIAIYRRHWIQVWPRVAMYVLLALALPAIVIWAMDTFPEQEQAVRVAVSVLTASWSAIWLIRAYFVVFRYRNDLWVLTNQRLVDSYKAHWFDHAMSSADLVNIQNISSHRSGLLQTSLNFGDLECETAGAKQRFVLGAIPMPSDALGQVDRARDTARAALSASG